ncbi:hypothetical protein MMC30_009009 [Trapelia coarctata]|nr:hypothetical protein [Trapelia coarctata]
MAMLQALPESDNDSPEKEKRVKQLPESTDELQEAEKGKNKQASTAKAQTLRQNLGREVHVVSLLSTARDPVQVASKTPIPMPDLARQPSSEKREPYHLRSRKSQETINSARRTVEAGPTLLRPFETAELIIATFLPDSGEELSEAGSNTGIGEDTNGPLPAFEHTGNAMDVNNAS